MMKNLVIGFIVFGMLVVSGFAFADDSVLINSGSRDTEGVQDVREYKTIKTQFVSIEKWSIGFDLELQSYTLSSNKHPFHIYYFYIADMTVDQIKMIQRVLDAKVSLKIANANRNSNPVRIEMMVTGYVEVGKLRGVSIEIR